MNRRYVFTLVFLLTASSIFGQAKYGFNAGFVFGGAEMVQPSVTGKPQESSSSSLFASVKAGANFEWPLNKSISLMPELNFINKGATRDFRGAYTYNTKYNMTFIELPLNIAYRGRKHGDFFIGGGPVFN